MISGVWKSVNGSITDHTIAAMMPFFSLTSTGSSDSSSSAHNRAVNASRQGQGPGKESPAIKAWRDARGDREKDLKQRKQEMLEAARRYVLLNEMKESYFVLLTNACFLNCLIDRKYLEKGDTSDPIAGPSGSSGPSSSHAPHSQVLSTS